MGWGMNALDLALVPKLTSSTFSIRSQNIRIFNQRLAHFLLSAHIPLIYENIFLHSYTSLNIMIHHFWAQNSNESSLLILWGNWIIITGDSSALNFGGCDNVTDKPGHKGDNSKPSGGPLSLRGREDPDNQITPIFAHLKPQCSTG